MTTSSYLAAAKVAANVTSDYGLAKVLGVTPQQVSKWARGVDVPSPLIAYRLAKLLKLDPARVVAEIERERAERAGKVDQVNAWRTWAAKLGAPGAAAAVVLSAGVVISTDASASISGAVARVSESVSTASVSYVNYAARLLRRLARHLAQGAESVRSLVCPPMGDALAAVAAR